MSNTVKQLGFIPTNRGEFDTTGQTRYYKDNVVQYRNGSYICSPIGYSSSNPTAYTTDAPYQDGDTELNANWKLMASVGLVDAEPTAGSDNLVKSGGVAGTYGKYTIDPEFVEVHTDDENRILYGVKADGEIVFGIGCPQQIKDYVNTYGFDKAAVSSMLNDKVDKVAGKGLSANDFTDDDKEIVDSQEIVSSADFVKVEIDSEGKILSGRKVDGTKFENMPTEIQGIKREVIEQSEWVDVKIDNAGRIIEGVKADGKKHISDFDEETKEMIKSFAGSSSSVSSVINIPLLDANFSSPVPVEITGTKGAASAKYEFSLPLKDAWNVRIKFKLTEDLLGTNGQTVIAEINGANVYAYPIQLSQCETSSDNTTAIDKAYTGDPFVNQWPAYSGGICFNKQTKDNIFEKMNIGRQAFSVRYVGQETNVSVENDGSALIFDINGVARTFSFITYPTVNELYAALDADTDFEVTCIALDYHNCSELAQFSSVKLVSTLHGNTNQTYHPDIIEYVDNGPFYLHYAVNEDWHQIELVKIQNKIYSVCDGNLQKFSDITESNVLTLGGNCGVLFKDLEIHTESSFDFEIISDTPISSVNPYIVILEAHTLFTEPTYEQNDLHPTDYNLTPDTLDLVFSWCKNKGYTPVSIEDIARHYTCGEKLPKRCYTIIHDGWVWDAALEILKKNVYLKYGVKPALAIEERPGVVAQGILHNGQSISIDEAVKIAKTNGFDIVQHTLNHTSTYAVKPSDRVAYVTTQVYSFESDGIDGQIYVFPGGCTDPYMNEVFEYLGIKSGIEVARGGFTNIQRNRFTLGRVNISSTWVNGNKVSFNPGTLINIK